jgi:hypothetical protein
MFTSGTSAGEVIGSYRGEPLYHASLDPTEYEHLLSSNGFEVRSFVPNDPACGNHTVWLALFRSLLGHTRARGIGLVDSS